MEHYGKYCHYELYLLCTFQLYISVLATTPLNSINELFYDH